MLEELPSGFAVWDRIRKREKCILLWTGRRWIKLLINGHMRMDKIGGSKKVVKRWSISSGNHSNADIVMRSKLLKLFGAGGRNRTDMSLRSRDFETETQVLIQPLDTTSGFPEPTKITQQK